MAPKTFHHGNLRQALIDAAVEIIAERGAEALTIREAARRVGVSSGAPFRHFGSRLDLLTAVAEDGMAGLHDAIVAALDTCRGDNPLVRLIVLGDAYLDWAFGRPTHYRVLGDRGLVNFYDSPALVRDNSAIRAAMGALLDDAQAKGLLQSPNIDHIHLQSRALAYGLTRMYVDGHLPEFALAGDAARSALRETLHTFIIGLARDPDRLRQDLAGIRANTICSPSSGSRAKPHFSATRTEA